MCFLFDLQLIRTVPGKANQVYGDSSRYQYLEWQILWLGNAEEKISQSIVEDDKGSQPQECLPELIATKPKAIVSPK